MAKAAEVQPIARDLIAAELGADAEVVSVSVKESTDYYGDDILVVRVVYRSKDKLDGQVLAGMVRHLRSRLSESIAEDRFPVLSFVSQSEDRTEAA